MTGLSATLEAGKRTSRVGTPCYLAPEILFNEEYGERVDIWGAGCIFYEMLTLDFLWERRGMLGAMVCVCVRERKRERERREKEREGEREKEKDRERGG